MSSAPHGHRGIPLKDSEQLLQLLQSRFDAKKEDAEAFVMLPEVQSLLKDPDAIEGVLYRRSEVVHCVFDENYEKWEYSVADMQSVMKLMGYTAKPYLCRPDDVHEVLKDVPSNGIMWLHCDLPPKAARGSKNLIARYVEANFTRVIGASAEYSENCAFKSIMYGLFEREGVPFCPVLRIDYFPQLEDPETIEKLDLIGAPFFMKVDDGFNSLGLSDACILQSSEAVIPQAKEMLMQYGPVVIQKFLSGREFTVAVSAGHAYTPVERIFETDQKFSGAEGTKKERIVDDLELAHKLQKVALAAYDACKGSAYGRVDIREDSHTGEFYVLEVNNNCSISHNSYFAMSLEASGSSRIRVFRQIMAKVL